ncbi:hypothetical protein [Paenibacillus sp. GCM10027626]|uniref:hypothetical protein n=1 Tax=Paenibacillus sp. GCM10027626 TaxID=3273411 RepID=UPI00362F6ED9
MKIAKLSLLLDRSTAERRWTYGLNSFEYYMEEVLSRAAVPYEVMNDVGQLANCQDDIVIAALVPDDQRTAALVWDYAERGGTVILCSQLHALAPKLGMFPENSPQTGYAAGLSGCTRPLRYFQAAIWRAADGASTCLIRQDGELRKEKPQGEALGAVWQLFKIGEGSLERWSVDITGAIVNLQQGTGPVLDDATPAPDGSAPLNEGILKADDRCAMDWEHDRLFTETGMPYFAYPYADLWREQFIGRLLQAALAKGMTLPFVGYWPDGIEQIAMISHDSDLNEDIHAESTLALLDECKVNSSWCMIEPGYSASIYDQVKAAGHELAFHYNALEQGGGNWSEEEFDRQVAWLKEAAGLTAVTSNKNHYTRYEGWGELFAWCEKNRIQSDQTRGPSKKGNVGFIFGTCHPYFPIAWSNEKNRMYDVVEIGFLTQDLDLSQYWSDSTVVIPFLDRVKEVRGVAHFLFHQVHIHQSAPVRAAFRKVIHEARKRGFTFWTAEQINRWERARRQMRITACGEAGAAFNVEKPIPGAVIWEPVAADYRPDQGEEIQVQYGVACRKHATREEGASWKN